MRENKPFKVILKHWDQKHSFEYSGSDVTSEEAARAFICVAKSSGFPNILHEIKRECKENLEQGK